MTRCFDRLLLALIGGLFAMTAQANVQLPPPQWLGFRRLLRALAGKPAI